MNWLIVITASTIIIIMGFVIYSNIKEIKQQE